MDLQLENRLKIKIEINVHSSTIHWHPGNLTRELVKPNDTVRRETSRLSTYRSSRGSWSRDSVEDGEINDGEGIRQLDDTRYKNYLIQNGSV